jgi:rubrerythrin
MGGGWNVGEFATEDLFEMAAIVEQGGFDFYARLIARTTKPQVKNELKFLRDEEATHKSFFLEQLRKRGLTPKGEVSPALRGLLDREFLEPMEKLYASGDVSDADKTLAFGVALEEKTIDFYAALRSGKCAPEQAADLDRIIAEEEQHKKKLGIMRSYWG